MSKRSESRRLEHEIPARSLISCIGSETVRRIASLVDPANSTSQTDSLFSHFDRVAARVIRPSDRLVIGQEDCCIRAFTRAIRRGACTLYDLPIAHHRVSRSTLLGEERLFPLVSTQDSTDSTAATHRIARKDRELALASHAVVPSRYVEEGLIEHGIHGGRISVIPYGCDPGRTCVPHADRKPLVLYVGHISLRKGIPRLLRVWKKLGAHRSHTLRLIGKMMLAPKFLADYAGMYEHIPQVPRSDLWAHYAAAQVFVFPSACDGFGLVLNEALSCGTPVIASSHTGAPGFVTHGAEGLIYPHGDDDQLAAHLDRCLSNPGETAEMGRRAYDLAQRWGWPQYRAAFREMVTSLIEQKAGDVCPR
jgi:glycosyltransferase involved in cell wall biosynthesis